MKFPITQNLKIDYPTHHSSSEIIIGHGLLQKFDTFLKDYAEIHRFIIVTDHHLKKIYGHQLCQKMRNAGYKVDLLSFQAGEKCKNEVTHTRLMNAMFRKKCGRDTMILALGGGVVGDMAGFIAATFMRGIPYIQIPTSYLAMVDSSIGAKVGIDTSYGKNLVGAFYPPQAIIIDLETLKTLPEEHFINGLFETIKIFLSYNRKHFLFFQKNLPKILKRDSAALSTIILVSIQLKLRIIDCDPYEKNERMGLNFGHTIGHALEYLSDYNLLHGFAVGWGMLIEAKMAELSKILSKDEYQTIEDFLEKFLSGSQSKNNVFPKFTPNQIIKATRYDKKNQSGKIRYILLQEIGKIKTNEGKFATPVESIITKKAIEYGQNLNIQNS